MYRRIEPLQQLGAVVIVPSRTRAFTVETALGMLLLRHLVVEADSRYRPEPKSLDVLSHYANSIATWQV